jgi:hypothetical protein
MKITRECNVNKTRVLFNVRLCKGKELCPSRGWYTGCGLILIIDLYEKVQKHKSDGTCCCWKHVLNALYGLFSILPFYGVLEPILVDKFCCLC